MKAIQGFYNTLHPSKGGGMSETFILVLVCIFAVVTLTMFGKEIPEILKSVITGIVGLYVGYKSKENEEKDGGSNDSKGGME